MLKMQYKQQNTIFKCIYGSNGLTDIMVIIIFEKEIRIHARNIVFYFYRLTDYIDIF